MGKQAESKLTAADYRSAAQKVRSALLETELGPHIESLAVLGIAHMEAEADRLDAEKATETESFEFLNELALAFRAAENLPRPQYAPVLEGVRAVLAHLNASGRLIPAGGMALTAEQVEDVRLLAASVVKTNRGAAFEARDRLRALFPATEPAEEETKAEAVEAAINMWVETAYQTTFAGLGHSDTELAAKKAIGEMRHLHLAEPWLLAKRITDILAGDTAPGAASVVPAPTETGPWKRIEDVPEGVFVVASGAVYVGGPVWRTSGLRDGVNRSAPFFASVEDQA